MISFTIAYPYAEGKKFDMDYYLNKHLTKTTEVLGNKVKGFMVEQGLAGLVPNTPPAFFFIAHIYFENITDFMETMALAGDVASDIPNYTHVTPMAHVAEVIV